MADNEAEQTAAATAEKDNKSKYVYTYMNCPKSLYTYLSFICSLYFIKCHWKCAHN